MPEPTSSSTFAVRRSGLMASQLEKHAACDELRDAISVGDIGDIAAKHEKLILHYYEDVQTQAKQSFESAQRVAKIGFWLLIVTFGYVVFVDVVTQLKPLSAWVDASKRSMNVGSVGVVSGIVVEFIAAVNFYLYSKASKQFGAFHICLERTHRYLVAYKIADKMQTKKDETLEKLVCIMANASMITREDVNDVTSGKTSPTRQSSALEGAELFKQPT